MPRSNSQNPNVRLLATDEYGGLSYVEWERLTVEIFVSTQNPIHALHLIREAHRRGVAPHKIAEQWLARSIDQWVDAEGTLSMDSIMKLKGKKGNPPPYKARVLTRRNEVLLIDVARLHVLGATIEQAVAMVARRLKDTPEKEWNLSKLDLKKIGSKRLRDEFLKWPERPETETQLKEMVKGWTSANMREYLQKFPTDCIPEKLKMYLN